MNVNFVTQINFDQWFIRTAIFCQSLREKTLVLNFVISHDVCQTNETNESSPFSKKQIFIGLE